MQSIEVNNHVAKKCNNTILLLYVLCDKTQLSKSTITAHLWNIHEAWPCCGNQSQSLNGAVHQLGENVTCCLGRLCAAVNLINIIVREHTLYIHNNSNQICMNNLCYNVPWS